MQFIQLLQENTTVALVVFALLGICVGSFLNVVIHRMPLMMILNWRQECSQFMAEQADMPHEHTPATVQYRSNRHAYYLKSTSVPLSSLRPSDKMV